MNLPKIALLTLQDIKTRQECSVRLTQADDRGSFGLTASLVTAVTLKENYNDEHCHWAPKFYLQPVFVASCFLPWIPAFLTTPECMCKLSHSKWSKLSPSFWGLLGFDGNSVLLVNALNSFLMPLKNLKVLSNDSTWSFSLDLASTN